jgi:hypothetical protein
MPHCLKYSQYYTYADDTQLLHSSPVADIDNAKVELEEDFRQIALWASCNLLKLNAAKTEFIIFRSSAVLERPLSLNLGGETIEPKKAIKVLGVMFDECMSFSAHCDFIGRKVTGFLQMLGRSRNKIPRTILVMLIQAYVSSQTSYCLSAVGVSPTVISRFQLLQNYAIRVIFGLSRFSHISTLREQLGWLSIKQQAKMKFALIAYKAVHGICPDYLSLNLSDFAPVHAYNTRSACLRAPLTLNKYGSMDFASRAIACYNGTERKEIWAENFGTFKKRYIRENVTVT